MKDLRRFGSALKPLHPSALGNLLRCPWRAAMIFLAEPGEEEAGAAADTGSAVHAAAAAFHRGMDAAASLGVMGARISEYPLADLHEAAAMFLAYAVDGRNACEVVLVEEPIAFQLEAAPSDPTGEPIAIEGTVDQVRVEYGELVVTDIKTSKKDPAHISHVSTHQLAAYCVGVGVKLGRPVRKAQVLCPRKYRPDGSGPVFWPYTWTWEDLPNLMEGVRQAVANIRAGNLWHVPGDWCFWCPAKEPALCYPALKDTRVALAQVP